MRPAWQALFARLPREATLERKAVLPAELCGKPDSSAVEGWEQLSVNLSSPGGVRHVLILLDASGRAIAASDWVMHKEGPLLVHETVGGRLEADGTFNGTRWRTVYEEQVEGDPLQRQSVPSKPTDDDASSIKALVEEVLRLAKDL